MIYNKWDIVLVPFPFSNQQTIKKRPGLILSPNSILDEEFDVVIAFMTSNLSSPARLGDYQLTDWKSANLPKPTMIRMKFTTIEYSIIIKKLGCLSKIDKNGFNNKLKSYFNL